MGVKTGNAFQLFRHQVKEVEVNWRIQRKSYAFVVNNLLTVYYNGEWMTSNSQNIVLNMKTWVFVDIYVNARAVGGTVASLKI